MHFRRNHRLRRSLNVESLEGRRLLAIVTLEPSQDTSLFGDEANTSNGAGEFLFTGRVARRGGSLERRALLAFDVAGQVPEGATISAVSLTLHMSRTVAGPHPASLHRVTAAWGEAGSDARGEEGEGIAAQQGDATWTYRIFPTEEWSETGGDFVAAASATIPVDDDGHYTWSSEEMIADVETWLISPTQNFGWMLIGNESTGKTAKRFDSRESPVEMYRPKLTIEYTEDVVTPVATVGNTTLEEGGEGTTTFRFPVTLDVAPVENVQLTYQTVDGTATESNQDYTSKTGTLIFTPNGPLTQHISIEINGDLEVEDDEQFTIRLFDPDGIEITDNEAIGTILNDDEIVVVPAVSIENASEKEGDEGITVVTMQLFLSEATDKAVNIAYATNPGTATDNVDFVSAVGNMSLPPGETTAIIEVQIRGDRDLEDDETFAVDLTGATNAVIDKSSGTVTIIDDDEPFVSPWQNPQVSADVNGDGLVTPFDALLVINELNGAGLLNFGPGELPTDSGLQPPPYVDTDGNGILAPLDALIVINHLNSEHAVTPAAKPVASISSDALLADLALAALDDALDKKLSR